MYFEVVVVGSGPAGCAAAICCAQQGLQTLMLTGGDKSNAHKEDGAQESIHPGVATVLAGLNAAHCIKVAAQGGYEGIEVNGVYNALGADEGGAWQGLHISRALFDAALLQAAIDQGVTEWDDALADITHTSDRVAGVTTKKDVQVTSLFVIDASGYKRVAGKQMGFRETFYSPPLVAWTGVSKCAAEDNLFLKQNHAKFIPHYNGWTWLAPGTDGRCTWTRLEVKGKQQFSPPDELQGYTLVSKIKKMNMRWRAFRPVCTEGLLLCGDAAGIIDPAAGQGILNALLSATMAAKTVKACISNPGLEALYLTRYDDWFMNYYLDRVTQLKHFYAMYGIGVFDAG